MAAGLINIVSYGATDLYLTGSPQITFYKMVYRRYTNFAMESISLEFDNKIHFGIESECTPPRIADLIHKGYLHIKLPCFNITYEDVGIEPIHHNHATDYNLLLSCIEILTEIYRIVYHANNTINVTYYDLIKDVETYVSKNNRLAKLEQYNTLLRSVDIDPTLSNLWHRLNRFNVKKIPQDILKPVILKTMQQCIEEVKKVQILFFEPSHCRNIRFAWVKFLGHSIIDYIDVYIGGKRIDRHLGMWFSIWYELTRIPEQVQQYNELIGNVVELTNFDSLEKPSFDLYIPLTFWFNRFNGLAFPLIAMQYNDIRFNVRLRTFEQVAYIEKIYRAEVNGVPKILTAPMIDFLQREHTITAIEEIPISLQNIFENQGKLLAGRLVLDYVYLENPERKKFAQSGHEYLIETSQYRNFFDISRTKFQFHLTFLNPSKEVIWIFNKNIYRENPNGSTECQWWNFSTGPILTLDLPWLIGKPENPVVDATILFNNYTRVLKQSGKYFDTLQPYTYHRSSPSKGINMYSFALHPLQFQPTGSANFTRLGNVLLLTNLNPSLFTYTLDEIYPFDRSMNWLLTIPDTAEFLETVDNDKIRHIIEELEQHVILPRDKRLLLDRYIELEKILIAMAEGKTNEIPMTLYRLIFFRTRALFLTFSLTINILRLIGGYGAVAYTSNR